MGNEQGPSLERRGELMDQASVLAAIAADDGAHPDVTLESQQNLEAVLREVRQIDTSYL